MSVDQMQLWIYQKEVAFLSGFKKTMEVSLPPGSGHVPGREPIPEAGGM